MSRALPHFGPYQALRRLGAGGMAETFVAVRHGPEGFEQRVCIKRVLPAYANDRDFVEGFLREARTSAALGHANIVQVLDFGMADDSHYLALELVDGLDLRALLAHQGGRSVLDAELVTLIAGDLAAALEHAHTGAPERAAVVHRDVSPSNVLVSRAGEIKLTDFGIARALGGTHITATGVIKGKVPYLPPEYIEQGTFDPRGDLFSLGVVLFELLAGERPFDGESDLDTIRRIVAGERRQLPDEVPRDIAACVERLVATDPNDRFESARALLDALPTVRLYAARKRLAERVSAAASRDRQAQDGGPSARTRDQRGLERTLPASSSEGRSPTPPSPALAAAPTRTREERRRPASFPGTAVALSLAGLAALALLLGATFKLREAGAGAQPPPPPLPTISAAPPPLALQPHNTEVTDVTSVAPVPEPTLETSDRPRAPAELRVVVLPFGDVWIDGKARGHAPVSARLSPGTHEIQVGDGRPEVGRTVQLRAGDHEHLVIERTAPR